MPNDEHFWSKTFRGDSRLTFQNVFSNGLVMNSATSNIGIAIDTATYGHHVAFLDEDKRTAAKPFHFKEDSERYQVLRKALD